MREELQEIAKTAEGKNYLMTKALIELTEIIRRMIVRRTADEKSKEVKKNA